jgi:tetratricopeptide (TPR) repeat protein
MRLTQPRKRLALVAALVCLLVLAAVGYQFARKTAARRLAAEAEQALERRDFATASSQFQMYLEIYPDDLPVRLQAARTARRQGGFPDMVRHLRLYEERHGRSDESALEMQLARLQDGDLQEADSLLSSCLAHPEAPDSPFMLEAIIEGTLKVLAPEVRSDLTPPANAVQKTLKETARTHQAVELWLCLRPGTADQVQGLVWRGRASEAANDHAQAVADLHRALEIDPEHFQARLSLAFFIAQQNPKEAAVHLERLHRHNPGNQQVCFYLASTRRNLGEFEEARRLLEEMLASEPNQPSALAELGELDMDTDYIESAERLLRRAQALNPDEPGFNFSLSRALNRAGKTSEARYYEERFEQLQTARKRKKNEGVRPSPGP